MDLPEIKVKPDDVKKGIKLLDFLSDNNIMSSKNEARRAIANNGLKINNNLINDEKKIIYPADFRDGVLKISHGKKKHYQVKIF